MKFLAFLFSIPLLGASIVIDSGSPTDQFFVGGSEFTVTTPGAPGDLTLRYGTFRYHIPQDPGLYLVSLNLRETGTVSAKGQRLFSVKSGGQTVLDRFDLFATAGLNAIVRYFVASSTEGFIDIDFSYTLKSAIVSSIQIQPLFQSTNPGTSTGPVVVAWSSCKSGLVLAGPSGPGVPSPTAVWPGLHESGWPNATLLEQDGTPRGWSCDGLQAYTFKMPNGSTDGPYVAVKMPADFQMDPALWIKQ